MTLLDTQSTPGRQTSLFHHDAPSAHEGMARSAFATSAPRRIDLLRERLPHVVTQVERRRLDLVEEGFVADYLALRWLEWRNGNLQLTPIGRTVHDSALG